MIRGRRLQPRSSKGLMHASRADEGTDEQLRQEGSEPGVEGAAWECPRAGWECRLSTPRKCGRQSLNHGQLEIGYDGTSAPGKAAYTSVHKGFCFLIQRVSFYTFVK